jgi:hypothetical protein
MALFNTITSLEVKVSIKATQKFADKFYLPINPITIEMR